MRRRKAEQMVWLFLRALSNFSITEVFCFLYLLVHYMSNRSAFSL
uniref:Uncharacterized protein n=1 Tax=Anguilla anguilla TaxID=7936 RepID=A0A0E9V1Q0_ANGAN